MRILVAFVCLSLIQMARATVSNVQAICKDGQTFITWNDPAPTQLTYEIYRSATPMTSTLQGTKVGEIFLDEAKGQIMLGGSRAMENGDVYWKIPSHQEPYYRQLGPEDYLFVRTTRADEYAYYAVVPAGEQVISSGQCTTSLLPEPYDPIFSPVQAHFQYQFTKDGYTTRAFAVWRMCDDDVSNDRPDFPVTATAN